MGRPTKPRHLKLLAGTLRADRERARAAPKGKPERKGTGRTPAPPAWLPVPLRLRWRRYCRLLIAERRATLANLDRLAVYLALDAQLTAMLAKDELPKNSYLQRHERLSLHLGLDKDESRARPAVQAPFSSPAPECNQRAVPATNRFSTNVVRLRATLRKAVRRGRG